MSASVKHSKKTSEQYTPTEVVEKVREVLGSIDLDPATSKLANKQVQAKNIFTTEDGIETFRARWEGNVFLNPPGGGSLVLSGTGLRSNPAIFWLKLMHAWHEVQSVEAAVVLGFTMEVLQTTQGVEEFPMLRFPFCVPVRRIAFDVPREEKLRQLEERLRAMGRPRRDRRDQLKNLSGLKKEIARLKQSKEPIVRGEQPPHGNVLVLVPPRREHHFGLDSKKKPWFTWDGPVTRRFARVFAELGYVRI